MDFVCPNCGKSIHLTEDMGDIFCPYCGALSDSLTIQKHATKKVTELREEMFRYFCNCDFENVNMILSESLNDVSNDPLIESVRAATDIVTTQKKYIKDAEELLKTTRKNGLGNTIKKIFLGADDYNNSSIHPEYFAKIQKDISALNDYLPILSKSSVEDASAIADLTIRRLLFTPNEAPEYTHMSFWADDHFCISLLNYLSTEELSQLHNEYATPDKEKNAFPNQKETITCLCALLENRGIPCTVSKPKWLFPFGKGHSTIDNNSKPYL